MCKTYHNPEDLVFEDKNIEIRITAYQIEIRMLFEVVF